MLFRSCKERGADARRVDAALRQQNEGRELGKREGWWALKARGEGQAVRRAAAVETWRAGQRARKGNDSDKEKRQNREPGRRVGGMSMRDEHQHER